MERGLEWGLWCESFCSWALGFFMQLASLSTMLGLTLLGRLRIRMQLCITCALHMPIPAAAVSDSSAAPSTAAVVTVHGSGPTPRQFYTKRPTFDTQLIPTLMAAGVEFGMLKQSVTAVLVR